MIQLWLNDVQIDPQTCRNPLTNTILKETLQINKKCVSGTVGRRVNFRALKWNQISQHGAKHDTKRKPKAAKRKPKTASPTL